MRTLTVAQGEEGSKGRVFQGAILAMVQADCWEGCSADTIRPAYLMVGTSEGEASPILANLRMGREAVGSGFGRKTHKQKDRIELLRKAGYEFVQQKVTDTVGGVKTTNVILQAFIPHIFRIDPGFVDPGWVRFCILPRREDVAPGPYVTEIVDRIEAAGLIGKDRTRYNAYSDDRPSAAEVAEIVPYAALFGAYLNARTRCPLVPDLVFLTRVLMAFLAKGYAHREHGDGWGRPRYESSAAYSEVGIEEVGLAPGLMVCATTEIVEAVLAVETSAFFSQKKAA